MTSAPAQQTVTYAVIIPDRSGRRVYLEREGKTWSLPRWETTAGKSWAEPADFNRTVRERLGMEVSTLRRLPPDPPAAKAIRIYEVENHTLKWHPPTAGRWVDRGQLDSLPIKVPTDRDLLAGWFAERERDIPGQRAPWARPGWFGGAATWISTQLDRLGVRATGPVEQERVWTISSVLRVPTEEGMLYFKGSAPLFGTEPRITRYAARRWPEHVPDVLAIDEQRSWMLMRDMGGTRLGRVPEIGPWEETLRVLARIQLESVGRTKELLASGFADRRLERLAATVDPLLAYAVSTPLTWRDALSGGEREALLGMARRLKDMCAHLAEFGLPETLEHGDCHAGNIVFSDGRVVIFDWSDGCVAHPFFILLPFLLFRQLPGVENARDLLLRLYLSHWTRYAPMERLLDAYEASRPLAALHQATAYWRILTSVEPEARWEWEADLPYFLRLLLPGPDSAL